MKIVKRILIGLLILVALIAVIGFFLPGKGKVTRSLTMKASPEAIFAQVNDFHNWTNWSPWAKLDPDMKQTYEGSPLGGPGAKYIWKGNSKVGEGEMEISKSDPSKSILIDMKMMGPKFVTFTFEKKDTGTLVTWTMETNDAGINPFKRWFNLLMDKFVGPDFEKGLTQLNELTARMPAVKISDVTEVNLEAMNVLTIHDSCKTAEIADHLGKDYMAIGQFAAKNNIKLTIGDAPLHHPFGIWYGDGTPTDNWVFDAGIVCDKKANGDAKVKSWTVPAGHYLMAKYWGSYDKTGDAHKSIRDYAAAKNMTINGAPWEVYVDDPTTKKSMSEVETDVYYPVK